MMFIHNSKRIHSSYFCAAGFVVVLSLLLSCGTTETAERKDEVVDIPDAYDETPVDGVELNRWCSDFGSTRLDSLVDKTFNQNMSLRSTWARLKQAKAAVREARAGRLPSVTATASGQRQQLQLPSFGPGGSGGSQTRSIDSFRTGVAASYEIDVWGKMANRHQAAQYDALAARADAESMTMSLTSQVANQWFELLYQRQQEQLLEQQLETSRQYLELTRLQFTKGQSTALNINQQRQQIQGLQSQLEQVRMQADIAETQLAVLTGRTPQTELDIGADQLPKLPEIPDPGIPADLLEQRPDVRAAALRLKSADRRVLVAIKNRLPSISLSANLFYQADSISNLFEKLLWSASGELGMPLFQGGRLSAQEDRARAVVEQRLYEYGQTLLDALKDVEDALTREESQRKVVRKLRQQERTAEKNLELARDRYQQGAISYFRVLDALRALQDIQRQRLQAERVQFANRIQLCRAIGGSWTKKLKSPLAENGN